MVKRTVIATAWLAGATLPLMVGALFVFGCCVLPFHRTLHRLMPLCDIAMQFVQGGQDAGSSRHSAPAPEKKDEKVGQKYASEPTSRIVPMAPARRPFHALPASRTAYRSFITLGALRCDQDVGLTVLDSTFRI